MRSQVYINVCEYVRACNWVGGPTERTVLAVLSVVRPDNDHVALENRIMATVVHLRMSVTVTAHERMRRCVLARQCNFAKSRR